MPGATETGGIGMKLMERELSRVAVLDFRAFLELMANKIREILLVSSSYDAFIIEEDVTLASRIVSEYSGLNLSQPPRVTRTSSALRALELLGERKFDLVITMPHLEDMDAASFGERVKRLSPSLPVYLLAHSLRSVQAADESAALGGIDKVFIWSGNADLLLSIVKSTEDVLNVEHDTRRADVCVLILVEDSPLYYSRLLPIFYKQIVRQIQNVLECGVNEEERLLIMRTRPKILLARNFEEASALYDTYKSNLLGVISDTRFPKQGRLHAKAGVELLSRVRAEMPFLPLLLMSSETSNGHDAEAIQSEFLDKNSPRLVNDVQDFFLAHLGFGEFVFRTPDGHEAGRADRLRTLEERLAQMPEESLRHHIEKKDLANWVMMRSEIPLATAIRAIRSDMFESVREMREYLISLIHHVRKWRQKGVVARFNRKDFKQDLLSVAKIGSGSLGGKARGLAFMSSVLSEDMSLAERFPECPIQVPQTLVLATDVFEEFVERNGLRRFAGEGYADAEVARAFLRAEMPPVIVYDMEKYLEEIRYPLAVRSSSLLEDAQFQPYAGLYDTLMIPNDHSDPGERLRQLLGAIKLVYASTWYASPKAFAKSTASQAQDEAMAVAIQQVAGERHGDFYYPAMAGVALSHNYYPVSRMRPEDGIVHMVVGFGKAVVEGGISLRFSPKHPQILPQLASVEDMLANTQRDFFSLRLGGHEAHAPSEAGAHLVKRNIHDALGDYPIMACTSTYDPADNRVRDSDDTGGAKVVLFSRIIQHKLLPLPEMLSGLLALFRKKIGCDVELEFAVNLARENPRACGFYLLQVRPMATETGRFEAEITEEERQGAFLTSRLALGGGRRSDIADIVFVRPEAFDPAQTQEIAEEIGQVNAALAREGRPYLLIGPGRWGSSDRWLGIPVQWRHISAVGAMVECRGAMIKADPSQGSHFFQNITSLGIPYVTVTEGEGDVLDWRRIESLPVVAETARLKHVRAPRGLVIKIDSRRSCCVMTFGTSVGTPE
ncbi:PEP/pyruvate-binding domain-containing protein [Fundidesulfovibrio terrae]|uniref:PEP/pyruvate-binding domain-containing protein n=1 Tax=Fundidesulfovibrio terrae TaxID=2922866 RepID=UPI001FAF01D3|nr:PEP/pyruvate-binding domain-containing protein [Fundidesulfovibrio terrae]